MGTEDGVTLNAIQEKMVDISEGNPGALSVLMQIWPPYSEVIDYLHEHGPKGPGLWMLYKDQCLKEMDLLFAELFQRMQKATPELATRFADRVVEAFIESGRE